MNILSIKVLLQFKVASIIATDQVEILGTIVHPDSLNKEASYNILSRVVHNDKFKSFKALGVRNFYFKEENNNILIPKVGLRFETAAGTYIIESNFHIKIKKFVILNFYT